MSEGKMPPPSERVVDVLANAVWPLDDLSDDGARERLREDVRAGLVAAMDPALGDDALVPRRYVAETLVAGVEVAARVRDANQTERRRLESELDGVYAERCAIVLAFAHMAELAGWAVGHVWDPDCPDWPVLMIDTPEGQVSWHLRDVEMPESMPAYPGVWDGHSTPEKYRRLERLVGRAWGAGREDA